MTEEISTALLYAAIQKGLQDGMDIPYFDDTGKRIGSIVDVEYDTGRIRATVRTSKETLQSVTID